ncbi:MAG: hypothetical protein J5I47_03570 [Vicingus serpentipes]|nr:hypothetical protein [Vicingus serpentipes]
MKQLFILLFIITTIACNSSEKVIHSNGTSKTPSLMGKWEVVEANIIPFEHISYCEKLDLGTVFEFQKDSALHVYPKAGEKACTTDQVYRISKGNLQITEIDMVFIYNIETLTSDTLKLKMNRVPSYFDTMKHPESVDVAQLKKEGVKLTLVKR